MDPFRFDFANDKDDDKDDDADLIPTETVKVSEPIHLNRSDAAEVPKLHTLQEMVRFTDSTQCSWIA